MREGMIEYETWGGIEKPKWDAERGIVDQEEP